MTGENFRFIVIFLCVCICPAHLGHHPQPHRNQHQRLYDFKALEICVCNMSFVNFFCSFTLGTVIIIHSNYPIVCCPLLQGHWISVKTCPVYSFNSLILLLLPPTPLFSLYYLEDNFHISAICLRKAQDLEAVADLGQQAYLVQVGRRPWVTATVMQTVSCSNSCTWK